MGTLAENLKTCMNCVNVEWRHAPIVGGRCACVIDRKDIKLHARDNDCPNQYYQIGVPAPTHQQLKAIEGRRRWLEYHTRALRWDGNDPQAEIEYRTNLVKGFEACGCKKDWDDRLASVPFVAVTGNEYFRLSIDDHNAVNRRLNKPEFSYEDALRQYDTR